MLKTREIGAGSAWDWAKQNPDALFNDSYTGLSETFINKMQPVFDDLGLNVDLAKVSFEFGGAKNLTLGYSVTLAGGTLDLPFDDALGVTLHELGHFVQFQNGTGILARLNSEIRQMAEVSQGRLIPDNEALPDNLDKSLLYEQDPYLRETSLRQLAGNHLLGPWTLDSQADRFRDLLLAR